MQRIEMMWFDSTSRVYFVGLAGLDTRSRVFFLKICKNLGIFFEMTTSIVGNNETRQLEIFARVVHLDRSFSRNEDKTDPLLGYNQI